MVTVVNYGELVGAVLVLTQILKGIGPLRKIEPQYLALAMAEGVALLAILSGQMPVSGLVEIATLIAAAGVAGATAVGTHKVFVKPLEPEKPLEPAVLPKNTTEAAIAPKPVGPSKPVVTVFFRQAGSMNPSEGIWKTLETVEIPTAARMDFRLHGTGPVFALRKGHGIHNPPVETKEHGVITQILEDVRALDGSRVDVFCK